MVGAPPRDATSGHGEAINSALMSVVVVVEVGGVGPAEELRGEGG